jgi:hypothetical protein
MVAQKNALLGFAVGSFLRRCGVGLSSRYELLLLFFLWCEVVESPASSLWCEIVESLALRLLKLRRAKLCSSRRSS